jgi:hypothetical protein
VQHLPGRLFRDRMVDLGFGLVHTLVSFWVCGVGAGERVIGAVYVAGAERLSGLLVRLSGQVPSLEVTGGLRQVLTMGPNVPGDDRLAILGVLADRLRGVLGLGAGPADLGFSGRCAGGLAGLPVAPSGGPAGGLVDRRVGWACLDVC